jgi:hypothetical protein
MTIEVIRRFSDADNRQDLAAVAGSGGNVEFHRHDERREFLEDAPLLRDELRHLAPEEVETCLLLIKLSRVAFQELPLGG